MFDPRRLILGCFHDSADAEILDSSADKKCRNRMSFFGSCEISGYPWRGGIPAAIVSAAFVMPGLVPGSHVFKNNRGAKDVDGRNKLRP